MSEQSFGPEKPKPERRSNDWAATVGIVLSLAIICSTIVLLVHGWPGS